MAWLSAGWGFLSKVPREVWYILLAGLAIWFYGNQRYDAGYEKRGAEYAEAARKATADARRADGVAGGVVDSENDSVEQSNERARDAARNSDDPLRDGLNELR